jgi:hypothetical protein
LTLRPPAIGSSTRGQYIHRQVDGTAAGGGAKAAEFVHRRPMSRLAPAHAPLVTLTQHRLGARNW